ncbi:hypothetical protein AAHA92_18666 [Salvia divinorum]|uniref:Hydroxyproline-rich glycoprotein family protein n=1 Tax=Salvia divinorum TaxID=28513 RepID=A0ABD1H2U7_SALDI
MSNVHNSVDTVNAAATAIVTAESRVQPATVQKRRWGSCWSIYWCFGSYKHSKRIGHAVIVSEPAAPGAGVAAPVSESWSRPSTLVMPFIAPPSSPASFLQSDPPSATQSPAGVLSLASLSVHAQSTGGTAPMFSIGPYAHETQLVSPPVFSTFTTEPSTACFTPPPESVQMTTPSSPEVPFAQLLSSSLARNRRNSGTNLKYNLSQYEFQPYQYPGSPGGHVKSPGSAMSTSGTSSPFPDKRPIMEFRVGEAPTFLGYEHFPNYKWDSRVGSGSLTPNGWGSRLGSGALTPNGGEPSSRDGHLLENQFYEVASLANSDHKSQNDDLVVDHRVSFELFGEDIPTCIVREPAPSHRNASADLQEATADETDKKVSTTKNADSFREQLNRDTANEVPGVPSEGEGEESHQKHRTISLGSSKEFDFNNPKGEVSEKSTVDCEWWISEEVAREETGPRNSWSFFPMLQSGAS